MRGNMFRNVPSGWIRVFSLFLSMFTTGGVAGSITNYNHGPLFRISIQLPIFRISTLFRSNVIGSKVLRSSLSTNSDQFERV